MIGRRLRNKARYLLSSLGKVLGGRHRTCPSCGGMPGSPLDRKAWVTTLVRCQGCRLLFRSPTSDAAENGDFYQQDYLEGFTTEMPAPEQLGQWLENGFVGTEKDYSHYIAALRTLGVQPGARLFDYGCSWGYGSHQLARAGFTVDALEISRPRAVFAAERLGVSMPSLQEVKAGSYDVFFSAHVIEHVPSVSAMIDLGLRLLRPGGMFVAFTPNGSLSFRRANPGAWHLMWGQVHPQLLDEKYLLARFSHSPLLIHSAPLLQMGAPRYLAGLKNWSRNLEPCVGSLQDVEMLFVTTNS